jgi:hypothetical protein
MKPYISLFVLCLIIRSGFGMGGPGSGSSGGGTSSGGGSNMLQIEERSRFLDGLSVSHPVSPELEGDTARSALEHGKVSQVLAAAENTAGAFS